MVLAVVVGLQAEGVVGLLTPRGGPGASGPSKMSLSLVLRLQGGSLGGGRGRSEESEAADTVTHAQLAESEESDHVNLKNNEIHSTEAAKELERAAQRCQPGASIAQTWRFYAHYHRASVWLKPTEEVSAPSGQLVWFNIMSNNCISWCEEMLNGDVAQEPEGAMFFPPRSERPKTSTGTEEPAPGEMDNPCAGGDFFEMLRANDDKTLSVGDLPEVLRRAMGNNELVDSWSGVKLNSRRALPSRLHPDQESREQALTLLRDVVAYNPQIMLELATNTLENSPLPGVHAAGAGNAQRCDMSPVIPQHALFSENMSELSDSPGAPCSLNSNAFYGVSRAAESYHVSSDGDARAGGLGPAVLYFVVRYNLERTSFMWKHHWAEKMGHCVLILHDSTAPVGQQWVSVGILATEFDTVPVLYAYGTPMVLLRSPDTMLQNPLTSAAAKGAVYDAAFEKQLRAPLVDTGEILCVGRLSAGQAKRLQENVIRGKERDDVKLEKFKTALRHTSLRMHATAMDFFGNRDMDKLARESIFAKHGVTHFRPLDRRHFANDAEMAAVQRAFAEKGLIDGKLNDKHNEPGDRDLIKYERLRKYIAFALDGASFPPENVDYFLVEGGLLSCREHAAKPTAMDSADEESYPKSPEQSSQRPQDEIKTSPQSKLYAIRYNCGTTGAWYGTDSEQWTGADAAPYYFHLPISSTRPHEFHPILRPLHEVLTFHGQLGSKSQREDIPRDEGVTEAEWRARMVAQFWVNFGQNPYVGAKMRDALQAAYDDFQSAPRAR